MLDVASIMITIDLGIDTESLGDYSLKNWCLGRDVRNEMVNIGWRCSDRSGHNRCLCEHPPVKGIIYGYAICRQSQSPGNYPFSAASQIVADSFSCWVRGSGLRSVDGDSLFQWANSWRNMFSRCGVYLSQQLDGVETLIGNAEDAEYTSADLFKM